MRLKWINVVYFLVFLAKVNYTETSAYYISTYISPHKKWSFPLKISSVNVTKSTVISWKVSKYGVFSGPYFPHSGWTRNDTEYLSIFSLNAWKYGTEKAPYLHTFYAVCFLRIWSHLVKKSLMENIIFCAVSKVTCTLFNFSFFCYI